MLGLNKYEQTLVCKALCRLIEADDLDIRPALGDMYTETIALYWRIRFYNYCKEHHINPRAMTGEQMLDALIEESKEVTEV